MNDYERLKSYERMGVSAILPGAIHLLTIIQDEVDRLRGILLGGALTNGAAPKKLGRPPGKINISPEGMEARKRGAQSYWASMTAEERTAEMQKRALVAGRKLKTPMIETDKISVGAKGYWAKMTAEERAKEMRRRMSMRSLKKGVAPKGMHPRDPAHPGHQAWLKKMSKIGKAGWARLTPEERAERVAKQSRRAA